jgi:hypothetical protein
MDSVFVSFISAGSFVTGLLLGYLSIYVKEKGKNLALREDSQALTNIVEQVRLGFAQQLEATKSLLSSEVEKLKHELSLVADAEKRYEGLKVSAYVDFYKATAGIAIAQKRNDPNKELEATIALTDAKARIAVYGSPEVAEALGVFFKEHGHLSSPEAANCFIEVINIMRNQTVGERGRVSKNVLARLFLGDDLASEEP